MSLLIQVLYYVYVNRILHVNVRLMNEVLFNVKSLMLQLGEKILLFILNIKK